MPTRTEREGSTYTPDSDMLDVRRLRRRITLVIALTSLISGTVAALGGRVIWPRENIAVLQKRTTALEAKADGTKASIDTLRLEVQANRYVGCQTLKLVQPKGAVLPQVCE